jgi:EAL and modified HD-GYP domain-containing signal transduction protein
MTTEPAWPSTHAPDDVATGVHISRAPVVDATGHLYGYELAFRPTGTAATTATASAITADTIASVFRDHHGNDLFADLRGYLTLPPDLLTGRLLLPFEPETAIVQAGTALAGQEPYSSGLRELADQGYLLALDDFVWTPAVDPVLQTAHIVKIDVRNQDWDVVRNSLAHAVDGGAVALVATRVSTAALAMQCVEAGFTHLQGPQFTKGEDLRGRTTGPARTTALQLLAKLSDPDIPIAAVQSVLQTDAALAHQVLRAANSAGSGQNRRISTLADAVMITGLDRLRAWALTISLSPDGPTAALDSVLVRARTCQVLADQNPDLVPDTAFTLGLLSGLADTLRIPSQQLLDDLPMLSPELTAALRGDDTPLRTLLDAVVGYERLEPSVIAAGLTIGDLAAAYLSALTWAAAINRSAYGG